jgi:PAS domain S-box-containing protein
MKFNLAIRNTLILAAIGIGVTVLVAIVFRNSQKTYRQNLPYIEMSSDVIHRVTSAHLLLEEAIAGDEKANYDRDVKKSLEDSKAILQGALDGHQTSIGTFQAMDDEDAAAFTKQAIIDIDNFLTAAETRWSKRHDVTTDSTGARIGPDLDIAVDEAYFKTKETLDKLHQYVVKSTQSDATLVSGMSWFVVLCIVVVFAVLGFFVFRSVRKSEKLIAESTQKLEAENKRVESLSVFIEAVSTGNYNIEIDETDDLSNKLITMRNTLRNNAEEDKRRNWATSGLAQIGEILRASGNIAELYDNIITFVVKYTGSNQGGMFLLNEDNEQDTYLELVSCYAFERKKYITKRVELGQGLVGQCYLEGARIHLQKIPSDYVHITSGLGGANPNSLLVIPMKVNDKTYGVIELATFKKYEEHEIQLVEKFAESIGASVSSVKVNESTRILLEKTQQQTEEMRAQEEEMRQNMEELEATQEEMRRKEKHIQEILETERLQNEEHKKMQMQLHEREKVLGLTTILSEADAGGTILFANEKLSEVSKYSNEEMIGRGHNLFRHPDMPKELFKLLWDTIKSKKIFRGVVKNRAKDGTHYWVDAIVVPIYENGVFVKYISARYHITDDALALNLYNKQAERLGLPKLS